MMSINCPNTCSQFLLSMDKRMFNVVQLSLNNNNQLRIDFFKNYNILFHTTLCLLAGIELLVLKKESVINIQL